MEGQAQRIPVFSSERETVGEVELPAEIAHQPAREHLLFEVVKMQRANRRAGTAATKTRAFVRGGGKKPWRQKGTGRARQGSRRAAQWVGGGRIHTPHPRSYEQRMPKKMRQAALRSALSAKAADADVVVVEDLNLAEPKTRLMAEAMINLVGNATVLVVLPEKDQSYKMAMRSADNLKEAKVLLAGYLNIRDLFSYDKLVLPVKALDALVANLG